MAALVNWGLSDRHFRRIYPYVGRIISVCEEDRQLTLTLAPTAKVDVIQNGVDGKSVIVAYSNEQFASFAVALLTDSVRREAIGKEARKIAEMFLDWKVLGKRLVQIINSAHKEILTHILH